MTDPIPYTPATLEEHAARELALADYLPEATDRQSALIRAIGDTVVALTRTLQAFEDAHPERADHSGLIIDLFRRVGARLPILPLEGTDDEWLEVESGDADTGRPPMDVNVRCPRVVRFRLADGSVQVFDKEGRAFRDPRNGRTVFAPGSEVEIKGFPYTVPVEPLEIVEGVAMAPTMLAEEGT